jgi:CheY-like chemotaxis protein
LAFANYPAPAAIDLSGIRGVVVDDNLDTLELLTVTLEKYGAEVHALDQAAAVIEALTIFRPHILICDIGMPAMDGYTLIQHVRSLPSELGQLPAIAVTAYVRDEDRQKALSQGFQRHMAKPIDLHQLASAVAQMCRKNN